MSISKSASNIRPITIDPRLTEQGEAYNVRSGKIFGWYKSTEKNTHANEIVLFVNGMEFDTTIANKSCNVRTGKDVNSHSLAFEFDVSDLPKNTVHKFELVHKHTQYTFEKRVIYFCALVNKFRAELRDVFFPEFYKNKQKLWGYSNREAFNHFASVGLYLDYPPNPWFSPDYYRKMYCQKMSSIPIPLLSYLNFEMDLTVKPSEHFCPNRYLKKNPKLRNLTTVLGHYVNKGHVEGLYVAPAKLPDQILNELDVLSDLEPELKDFVIEQKPVVQYPILARSTFLASFLKNSFSEKFEVVLCVPYLSCGGADLISLFTLKAYQHKFGVDKVLLLVTDRSENSMPSWLDKNTNVVFLDDETDFSSFKERVKTLHTIVGVLCPKIVVNVNSHAAWSMFEDYGRQLSSVVNLVSFLFCFDYKPNKSKAGYIVRYLPKTLKYLKLVMFDNQKIVDDIDSMFGFPSTETKKLNSVYVPLPKNVKTTLSHIHDRKSTKKILWTGRLARQKRPELLVSIANSMPNYTFVVYGPLGDAEHAKVIASNYYDNIDYRGVYSSLKELDISEFDLFLNTSEWDGLPTVLIQMMGLGLPVVTSDVGGIEELVTGETGWLVRDHSNCNSYVFQIKNLLVNSLETYRRVSNGIALVTERHSWAAFTTRLNELDAFNIEQTGVSTEKTKFERRKAVRS